MASEQMEPINATRLVSVIKEHFLSVGVDICGGFSVARYNGLVKFQLPTFGCTDPLGVILGSTKAVWPHFISWLSSLSEIPKDPVDSFYRHTVENILCNLSIPGLQYEIRYDWDRPATGRFVHVQTAGHLAGVAHYDQESYWSCHPEYGLWFVYRAAVVFNVECMGEISPAPAPHVLSTDTVSNIRHWYEIAVAEKWQNFETRLRIRDACPIGKAKYRYDGDMLDYFFPISQPASAVLSRIKAKIEESRKLASPPS